MGTAYSLRFLHRVFERFRFSIDTVWCKKSDDGLASSFAIKIGSVNVSFRAMEYAKPCILPRHSGVLCTRTRQLVLRMHDWVWEWCDWQLVCSNWGSPRLELHPKGDCELRFVCRCGCLDSWFFAIVVFCCRSFR